MKKIAIGVLLALSVVFAGCQNTQNNEQTEKQPVKLEQSEYADLSENMYSYEIKLDGVKYTLPADISEFKNNGWELTEDDPRINIPYQTYLSDRFEMKKDDKVIKVKLMNKKAGSSGKLDDCSIGEVSVYSYDDVPIIISKGITIGSSVDDLKTAFGEPQDKSSYGEDSTTYKYNNAEVKDSDVFSNYWISVDDKTNMVKSITATNLLIQ